MAQPVRVLVLHGPNLNMLGTREPALYGTTTLAEIDHGLRNLALKLGALLETHQTNSEADLIGRVQRARGRFDVIVLNPAAFGHTSLALRDALLACEVPCYEVHLTNTKAREPFRRTSFVEDVCVGRVEGFGAHGYEMAFEAAVARHAPPRATAKKRR